MLGNFSSFCCRLLTFFKINFFKKFIKKYYEGFKFYTLGPNCLQRLSADDSRGVFCPTRSHSTLENEKFLLPCPKTSI